MCSIVSLRVLWHKVMGFESPLLLSLLYDKILQGPRQTSCISGRLWVICHLILLVFAFAVIWLLHCEHVDCHDSYCTLHRFWLQLETWDYMKAVQSAECWCCFCDTYDSTSFLSCAIYPLIGLVWVYLVELLNRTLKALPCWNSDLVHLC